jgi:hypothetical protein
MLTVALNFAARHVLTSNVWAVQFRAGVTVTRVLASRAPLLHKTMMLGERLQVTGHVRLGDSQLPRHEGLQYNIAWIQ